MLARVAERVYWLGRYMERSENTARLVNVNSNLLLDLPRGAKVGWRGLIDIIGCNEAFDEKCQNSDERNVMRFLLADNNNPVSILSALRMARENTRTTREILPAEAWEQINDLYLYAKENLPKGTARGQRYVLLQRIIRLSQQLTGLLGGTMCHGDAYNFILLGRYLERADMTTRIVDVGSDNSLQGLSGSDLTVDKLELYADLLWMSVLTSLSAYQMYRQNAHGRVKGETVVSFLLQDSSFPRSVAACLNKVETCLHRLPRSDQGLRVLASAKRRINDIDIDQLFHRSLHEFIDNLQLDIAAIHDQIAQTWFLPNSR